MALLDTLSELAGTGPATRNRVSILLDQLKSDESNDYTILLDALANRAYSSAKLTKALRTEYGHDVVKDNSVAEYRRTHTMQLTGL